MKAVRELAGWILGKSIPGRGNTQSKGHVGGAAKRLLAGMELKVRKEEKKNRKRGQRRDEATGALQLL